MLLEIDVQGAEQVLAQRPDATVILLLPPSVEVQAQRLAARGDDEEHIRRRVELGRTEIERGARPRRHTVVNDDLHRALADLTAIVRPDPFGCQCAANPEEPRWPKAATRSWTRRLKSCSTRWTRSSPSWRWARRAPDRSIPTTTASGEGLGKVVPPQVASVSGKPVSIAFEEIAAGKATFTRPDPEEEAALAAAMADAAEAGLLDETVVVTEVAEECEGRGRRGGRGARWSGRSASGTRTRPRARRAVARR